MALAPIGPGEDPVIGCLFVRDVRFFPAGAVADPPPQFARNIVQGKSRPIAVPRPRITGRGAGGTGG
jgi:putative restriction endonuclease